MPPQEHRSTARVLDILSLLASSPEGFTLNDISKLLDAPRTSLYPIIQTMANRNFITLNKETSRYLIGFNAYATGAPFLKLRGTYGLCLDEMKKIVVECGEMCQLGVLDGHEVLYIGKIDSPAAIRTVSYVGKRLPVHCTSLGKALIHRFTWEDVQSFFTRPLEKFTQNTITDPRCLYEQLEEIKKNHFAYEVEETQDDIRCFAVPICKDAYTVCAISVTIPVYRFTEALQRQCLQSLLKAKERLETVFLDIPVESVLHLL